MSDLKVRRWAGPSGVAAFVVFLVALPLYFGGMTNGGTDYTAFWSAPGYVTFVAQVATVICFLIARISMLLKRDMAAPMARVAK